MDNSGIVTNSEIKTAARHPVANVGMALREAREEMGLSVHDIANRIKFAPRQVEALEANDFENLPQATFLRGFVRSYARVLQLDEAALIAALPADPAAQVVARTPVVDVAFPNLIALQRVNLLWLAGALGVVLVLMLFIFTRDNESTAKSAEVVVEPVSLPTTDAAASAVADAEEPTQTAEVAKVTESAKAQEPVVLPRKPEPVAQQKPAEPVVALKKPEPVVLKKIEPAVLPKKQEPVVQQKKPEPAKAKEPVVKPAPQAAAAPAEDAKSAVPLESLMRRPLHFVFSEAMFAEVIDARGTTLLSRNVPRGTEKWIGGPGRSPYKVTVSNPRKVKLYYKGSPIDLSAYPATEMAHLTVQ